MKEEKTNIKIVTIREYAKMAHKNTSVQTAREVEFVIVNPDKDHTTLDVEQLAEN